MAQTKAGIEKQRQTNIKKFGSEEAFRAHMRQIASNGGKATYSGNKGFAANRELARIVGAKGGRISKRGPSKNG